MDRITFNPAVLGGRATVRGLRICVSHIVNLVANGMKIEEILADYPEGISPKTTVVALTDTTL